MSPTAPITSTGTAAHDPAAPTGLWSRTVTALYVVLLLSLTARLVFTAWEPPFDGVIRYDEIRPLGGAYWPMNLYFGGPAYLVSFVTTAVFVVLLARGRAGALNLVAAALIALGGTVFSLVITAEVLPFTYAADPQVLPEAEGRALFDTLNRPVDWLEPAILGGMAAVAAGVLLTLVAGWASRTLPRWLAAVGVTYLVVLIVLPPGLLPRPAELGLYLVELALLATLGWFGLRAAQCRLATTAP